MRSIWVWLRWGWRYGSRLALFALFFVGLVPRSSVLISDRWQAIAYQISPYAFDYLGWEVQALTAKAHQVLFGVHPFMNETARSQLVRDYMADLTRAQQMEAELERIYTDPNLSDPDQVAAEIRQTRDALRHNLRQRQLTIEAILEGQVAAILVEQGFGVAGQLLPPMAMHFTPVPHLLVTSPRDQIRMETSLAMSALPTDQKAALEADLERRHEVSALIVPLGGIALYPAMVLETTSIPWAVETFAHEWLHHYLFFYPLGWHYFTDVAGFASEARTINETTADLFGKTIARLVLARYYPELVPPDPQVSTSAPAVRAPIDEVPAFDFGATMHETRVTVDKLLAEGEIDAAESYMEAQRRVFYEQGYRFRRLNQAFFAFYGGYQSDDLPGIGGEDPVGVAVKAILTESDSLHEFVLTMRDITNRETLLQRATTLRDD